MVGRYSLEKQAPEFAEFSPIRKKCAFHNLIDFWIVSRFAEILESKYPLSCRTQIKILFSTAWPVEHQCPLNARESLGA